MCNVLTQIIMPSFLGHFPMFYAFFSTKNPYFYQNIKNKVKFDFLTLFFNPKI
jgi:hypothetical protein